MTYIDCSNVKQMIQSASNNLLNKKDIINDLNVFPVPDGDTGTNMSLTFSTAAKEVCDLDIDTVAGLLDRLASSALRNARGNSGVILSQIIRGIAKGVEGKDKIRVADIKNAVASGRDTAYRAVMKPTEGTILTVIRETAEFAECNFEKYDDIIEFLSALLDASNASLNGTKEMLPILKQSNVVDAGGMGLTVLLDGALYALKNVSVIESDISLNQSREKVFEKSDANIKYLYCTEFIINKNKDRQVTQFSTAIKSKGDCMLVIEDEDILKVHIHTNHPGYILEQALKLGELTDLKIDNMRYQHNEKTENTVIENKETEIKKYGFIAVSTGGGIEKIFKSMGVDIVVNGGQTMNPSTQDLIDAVESVNAETVFVLPNNKNIIMTAQQIQNLTNKQTIVIPTRNIPQGISAMMEFSENMSVQDNIDSMTETISTVLCGQTTTAVRDTNLDSIEIKNGDIIGIVESNIVAVGQNSEDVTLELIDSLMTEYSDVISIYYGNGVNKIDAENLFEMIKSRYSGMDVTLYYGGQSVYYYIVSVE